jgi:hypothetical protein
MLLSVVLSIDFVGCLFFLSITFVDFSNQVLFICFFLARSDRCLFLFEFQVINYHPHPIPPLSRAAFVE